MSLKSALKLIPGIIVLCLLLSYSSAPTSAAPLAVSDPFPLIWSSTEIDWTNSIAWGDYDRDGDLDMAVGNGGQPVRLYRNDDGVLNPTAVWSSDASYQTESLAWGDVDGDGYLDLAVGNSSMQPNVLFLNYDGKMEKTPSWSSNETDQTYSVAWGDVNGDGHLDLAVGNFNQPARVYLNNGKILSETANWSSGENNAARSVAWGNVDGDRDLDLMVGNLGQPNRLYINLGDSLELNASWSSTESDSTYSVAWGDYDKDGSLDLAVGNSGQPNRLYHNSGVALVKTAVWSSWESDDTRSVSWGDYDGDGYLDLAAGNYWSQPSRLYHNNDNGTSLGIFAVWSSKGGNEATHSVAWGDVDLDGDLDLAIGNFRQPNRLYRNDGGTLTQNPVWSSNPAVPIHTTSVAWGDYDGDGYLDLAAGNAGEPIGLYHYDGSTLATDPVSFPSAWDRVSMLAWGDVDGDGDLDLLAGSSWGENHLYQNDGGVLNQTPVWTVPSEWTSSVAWGDVDLDGDLDLATVGSMHQIRVFLNNGGTLDTVPVWSSFESYDTVSIAWGDVDGDGDLDLAAGNNGKPNCLFRNDGGTLTTRPVWYSTESDTTYSVAWGDIDGDGDLDLVAGNAGEPNRLYRNDNGVLTTSATWSSIESDYTVSVALGDVDVDGDLDLAVGNRGVPSRLYRNDGGTLTQAAVWSTPNSDYTNSVAWGDVDRDGDLDLVTEDDYTGHQIYLYRNDIYPASGSIPRVQVSRPEPPENANFYSAPNIWSDLSVPVKFRIIGARGTSVSSIRAFYSLNGGGKWEPAVAQPGTELSSYPASPLGQEYTFYWDVGGSSFFGQSDNVVFRIVAIPAIITRSNSAPGSYQFASSTSQTFFPFRVRGTQVRVMKDGLPLQGAIVHRAPGGQASQDELITDSLGNPLYTDGEGYLQGKGTIGINDRLVAMFPISSTTAYDLYYTSAAPNSIGLDSKQVTGSGVQTLMVSSANPLVLFNLDVSLQWDARNDLEYISQLEYSLQRASEILYDWTNGQAALGRLTIYQNREKWNDAHIRIYASNRIRPMALQGGITSVVLHDQQNNKMIYAPGQVHLGPSWTRYGDPGADLGDDWPRALAHELGHYAFYLNDNYLGLDSNNRLMDVSTCPGAMADPYRLDYPYDELHPDLNWLPGCARTFTNLATGRSDWSTVHTFYPSLYYQNNPGPSSLPLDVTRLDWVEPAAAPTAIVDPTFFLKLGGSRYQPASSARAFLFQDGWAIDLGNPKLDRIVARGAKPGDRLCLYEMENQKLGCATLTSTTSSLDLYSFPAWQPNIAVTPVNTTTLKVKVTNLTLEAGKILKASFYPLSGPGLDTITLDYNSTSKAYEKTFFLSQPVLEGFIQLYVDETAPRRETITDFSIGGNPISMRGSGISMRGSGISMRGSGVPVLSPDGHVMLFMDDSELAADEFYTLYSIPILPSPLPWTTLIGRAYQLTASTNAPELAGASIQIGYLGSEVPPGEETWLSIYFLPDNSTKWQLLPTSLNTAENYASATTPGTGVYALLSALQVHLSGPDWNMVPYPIETTRAVATALASINGIYNTVCRYFPDEASNPWRCYGSGAPSWANDLINMEYGSYWIYATQPITLYLKGSSGDNPAVQSLLAPEGDVPFPPAVYYGAINTPLSAGSHTVTARVDGQVCGLSTAFKVNNQLVYVIDVLSGSTCGSLGKKITFWIDKFPARPSALWDNTQMHSLPLEIFRPRLFLPMLFRK